jgi:hypothetical protein
VVFCGQKFLIQMILIKKCFRIRWDIFVAWSYSQLGREILWRTFENWRWCPARCGSGSITVKRPLCCGFRRTGKAMGQLYRCWWKICQELNVFPGFECHMFYVLYPFVTHLLIIPRNF